MTLITESTTRKFEVTLTTEELADYGQQSARLTLSLVEVQEEHAAQKKDFAAREKGIVNQISKLSHSLAEGKEMRDVECRIIRDYDKALVTVVRCDTGELIEERPFTNAEMTLPLPPDEEETVARMDAQNEGEEGESAEAQAEALRQAEPETETEEVAAEQSEEERFNALMGASGDGAEIGAEDVLQAPPEEASTDATDGLASEERPNPEHRSEEEKFNDGLPGAKPKRSHHKKKDEGNDAGANPLA